MTPGQYERVRDIYLAARDKEQAERATFLDEVCAGDDLVRREVESLLGSADQADTFLRTPALGSDFAVDDPALAMPRTQDAIQDVDQSIVAADEGTHPERLGQYQILGVLGEGGMGVVYEAQQEQPRRRVALKVIKAHGTADAFQVRLFQREVEALARLKHPGIAAIYDAGRTEDGRHFFAMELIRGETLLNYANARTPGGPQRARGTRERLHLFCKTCDAINYAHQRGVTHRDLKPSNILVSDESGAGNAGQLGRFGGSSAMGGCTALGVDVKVLDFGLARITDGDASQTTLLTQTGRVAGTLAYMSPEQARGDADAIDLRSDVYSLGVILYELLTGQLPYEIARAAPHQALRAICEDSPRRPSSINHTLRGDLEIIALKALEKDPDRRYANAAALAEDVRRQVTGEPILARPPSAAYQISKLVARHKISAALLGLLALTVVSFAAITAVQAERVVRERDKALLAQENEATARAAAETESEKAQRIQRFLQDILASVAPGTARGRDTELLKDLLADAAWRVETELADQPSVAAEVRTTIGRTYAGLGLFDKAEPHLRAALAFHELQHGEDAPETATALDHLGMMLTRRGDYAEAEQLLRRALDIRSRKLGEGHVDLALSYHRLGKLAGYANRYEEAEELLRRTVEIRRSELDTGDRLTAEAIGDLAWLLGRADKLDEAVPLFREAVEMSRTSFGPDHPDTAMCINNLASVLKKQGEYDEAAELYGESLAIQRRVLGDDHPDLAEGLVSWADLLKRLGRYAEAESLLDEAVEIQREHLGEENDFFAAAISHAASVKIAQGNYAAAEPLYRRALEIYRGLHGDRHMAVLRCQNALGTLLSRAKRYTEAEPVIRDARQLFLELYGEQNPGSAVFASNLASVLTELGELEEAESLLREVVDFRREFYGEVHPKVAISLYNLANVLFRKDELTEAEELYAQALAVQQGTGGGEHPIAGRMFAKLADLHMARGDLLAAAGVYTNAYLICVEALPAEHPDRTGVVERFATLLLQSNDVVEAELAGSVLREYLETVSRSHPEDADLIARVETALNDAMAARPSE